MIAPVAIQTGWNRDPKIQQSDFERVVGRVWVCSRLSWIFGAFFALRGCVRGVGSAQLESADLRASIPATLRHAPSRVGRRRGYLGLSRPSPGFSSKQKRGERTFADLIVRCARSYRRLRSLSLLSRYQNVHARPRQPPF